MRSLKVIDYWDLIYELKQQGVNLNLGEYLDSTQLHDIRELNRIDYIVTGEVLEFKDGFTNPLNNPEYMTNKVSLNLYLHDVRTMQRIWFFHIDLKINPLIVKDHDDDQTYYNATSNSLAAKKAYQKGIKILMNSLFNHY